MNRKPYPKYKESGVEWLGQVPGHWEVKRLKMAAHLNDRKAEANEENPVPYIGMENIVSYTGKLLPIDLDVVPSGVANRFTARNTLFGKLRPYLAKACNPDFDGLCSTELLVIESESFDRRALLYWLLADGFIKLVDSSTYGSKMPRANWGFIGNCLLPVPPLPEQTAIADFLDRETGRIDTLVAKKRRLIALLGENRTALISRTVTRGLPADAAREFGLEPHTRFKDSGIEWLGEVPEGWTVKKLGHLSVIVRGGSPRPAGDPRYFDGDHIPWITVGEVTKDTNVFLETTETMLTKEGASCSRTIKSGTLIITNSGATLGVPKILKITGCANDGIVAFEEVSNKTDIYFLYYFLSSLTNDLRNRLKQGGGQPNLNTDLIKAIAAPFPNKSEQTAIATYLDRETAKIDQLVAKVEAAIARLQEYRTALITAAVTGKIDVREEVA
jgi:type I restriction enzyme S subunit